MQRVSREIISSVIEYKANDGTVFTTESECKAYEATALCVIRSNFMNIVEYSKKESKVFDIAGSDEYMYHFVKVDTKEKADIIKQLIALPIHSQEYIDKQFKAIDNAYKKKALVIIGNPIYDNNDFTFLYIVSELLAVIEDNMLNIIEEEK